MSKVLYLEKGKILVPYVKEDHIENVGSFAGFNTEEGEPVFIASPMSIHHAEFLKILREKLPNLKGEPIVIGTAHGGSVVRDEICFCYESGPQEYTSRFCTPKKEWDPTIKIFGFHVVSVN